MSHPAELDASITSPPSQPVQANKGFEMKPDEIALKELMQERDSLKAEVAKLKTERDEYLGFLYALTHKQFDFNKEELLGLVGKQKPLRQFIAELEHEHGD
jgi:hypothetical protein